MASQKINWKNACNCLIFFFVTGMFISLVDAAWITKISSFKSLNGNFEKVGDGADLSLVYHTTLNEGYVADHEMDKFSFSPESEIYCWEGCNVYPRFIVYQKEIRRGNETIALQELKIPNSFSNNLSDIFSVYEDKKFAFHLDAPNMTSKVLSLEDASELSEGDYLVNWEGKLVIQKSGAYTFDFDTLGYNTVVVNDTFVLSSFENLLEDIYLEEGIYSINVSYRHNVANGKPNLFWSFNNGKKEIVPDQNLIFSDGFVQKGFLTGKSSSSRSTPASYFPDYSLYPSATLYIPSSLENARPLILVHGLHGEYPYWNQLPERLTSLDNDVWQFYYADANVSNFMTSGLLGWGIDTALSYYSSGAKANVVAHSMGTFVALGYIDNLGKDAYGNQVSYNGKIGNVVLVGGPIHGSYLANRVLRGESAGLFCGDILNLDPDDPEAQAYLDLAVGSEFTWLLNQNGLNSNIRYLTVVGSEGIPCIPDETYQGDGEPGDGNDGFLAVASGSLLDKNVNLVVFTGDNHANLIGQREGCVGSCSGACQDYWLPGFCHTSSKVDREVNIINGFFRSYSENTLRNYLMGEDYYIKPNDASNPYNKGSVVLKVTSAQLVNEVKLKRQSTGIFYILTKYHDDVHFTQLDNWFYYSNNNPSMSDSNSLYGITFPKGNYDIYVNGQDTEQDVEVKGAETTMKEINLGGICVTPTNNMEINVDTVFCQGEYYLPDGIKIVSDNVILDCNGSKLFGDPNAINDIPLKQGIWIQRPGVTVRNCEISNYFYGIFSYANNLLSNKLLNNTLHDNKRAMSTLNKHEISFNRVYNNQIVGIDVTVSGTTANVSQNLVYNNSAGIVFDSGMGSISSVNWNEIYDNSQFSIALIGPNDLDATNNWWGTNNETEIAQSIIDFYDNGAGIAYFIPFIERSSECVPNLVNITLLGWQNISCLSDDTMNQSITLLQYDSNNCGITVNQTFIEYKTNESCDYCSPNPINTNWTEWQNQTDCLAGDYYLQNRSKIEYDSNYESCYMITNLSSDLWNDGLNLTDWEFQNKTCDFCTPILVNTTWSNWINIGQCSIQDTQNQSRFRVQYDFNNCSEVQNQTFYEYNLILCDYCSQDIQGPFYTEWSECNEQNFKIRVGYYRDYNFSSCCLTTGLDSDCEANTAEYQNFTENSTDGCGESPVEVAFQIASPSQYLFNERKVQINLTVSGKVDKITYIDMSDDRPREKTLCGRNCLGYGYDKKKFVTFREGVHDVIFRAIKDDIVVAENTAHFLVDSKKPKIYKTEPKNRGISNGEFYVEFGEDNPVELILKYGNDLRSYSVDIEESCYTDRTKQKCSFSADLPDYDGTNVPYWFELRDIVGNEVISRTYHFDVDTTLPVVNDLSYSVDGRRVNFMFNVTEENFDEINYIDWNDSKPREIRLCSKLKDGICEVRKTFRAGGHSLTLKVLDEAGNFVEQNIAF